MRWKGNVLMLDSARIATNTKEVTQELKWLARALEKFLAGLLLGRAGAVGNRAVVG